MKKEKIKNVGPTSEVEAEPELGVVPVKKKVNLMNGLVTGKSFATFQPTPQQKRDGWQKMRAQKLLTQQIIASITKGNGLENYVASLIRNAKMGNPKAIDTINKGMEDDVIKIAQTDTDGNTIDFSKFTDDELRAIADLQRKGGTGKT